MHNSMPIGTVYVDTSKNLAVFGILAVMLDHAGNGVGRLLIAASEEKAREKSCTQMKLEVVMPSEWVHPTKAY